MLKRELIYKCDLQGQSLFEFFDVWDKNNDPRYSYDYRLFFSKKIDKHHAILNRDKTKAIESPEFYLTYDAPNKILNIKAIHEDRTYALFLWIPASLIIIWLNKEARFWHYLIPLIAGVILFAFFKWVLNDEVNKFKKEIQQEFNRKHLEFTLLKE